ncbi:hypothetical protein QFZ47_003887 [Variovorax paradoxus]|nr:hypothetical protein [Variovorax paradoxus]
MLPKSPTRIIPSFTPPQTLPLFPAAVEHRLRALHVVAAPLVRDGDDLRVGRGLAHVGVVGHGHLAPLLRSGHHGGGAGVEGDHIGVLVEQRHGGIAFLRRIEPLVEPHHDHLGVRIHGPHAERERVDALQHLGNRKARHVARNVGLRHAAGRDAREVAAFVVARVGGGNVGRALVAGDRFELHVGKVARHLERRLHVAEAGREDQPVALLREVADHALGVGALWHVLDEGGPDLAAERRIDGLAALFMLAHPAGIGDRRDVDEADLQRLLRSLRLRKGGR